MPIPKNLHFVWLGPPLPASVERNIQRFADINPTFDVRIWRDRDLTWLENRRQFDQAHTLPGKADVARYEIVLRHGGMYFDTDFFAVRSLEPVIEAARSSGIALCAERSGRFNNAFFAATPDHPLLRDAVSSLPRSFETRAGQSPTVQSGPEFLSGVASRFVARGGAVTTLPRDWFYPYFYDKPENSEGPWADCVVAVHQWGGGRSDENVSRGVGSKLSQNAALVKDPQRLRHTVRGKVVAKSLVQASYERLRHLHDIAWLGPQPVSIGEGIVLLRDREGSPLLVPAGDLDLLGQMTLRGRYDVRFHRFLAHALSGSDVFVDVGANVGIFSLLAARRLSRYGRVISFEPNPRVREILERNVLMRATGGLSQAPIVVRPEAVGSESEVVTLRVPVNHWGRGSVATEALTDVLDSNLEEFDVSQVRLDDVLKDISRIRLVKIDVEGNELAVIQGMSELIDQGHVDMIDFEFIPEHLGRNAQGLEELVAAWCRSGARVSTLDRLGRSRAIAPPTVPGSLEPAAHILVDFRTRSD